MWNGILRHFSSKSIKSIHYYYTFVMSTFNFNKEEEITLIIHSTTHPSILKPSNKNHKKDTKTIKALIMIGVRYKF